MSLRFNLRRVLRCLPLAATLLATVPLTIKASDALPVITLQAGIHQIQAEIADTPESRQIGLMNRQTLAPDSGMLFVFEEPRTQCFWMRNTYVPLSIAFLDKAGRIINIADMQPLDETLHCSAQPVTMALEMAQGWFVARNLAVGSILTGLPASTR